MEDSSEERRRLRHYAAGMATEALYVGAISAVAFILALIAEAMWG